jgi:RimK family alpha-L-glutamate ligase
VRLQRALRARGAGGRCVDLAQCRIDTTHASHGLAIPGFGRDLPDAALVRGIAGGSFEQVTVRLGVLHALREAGVPVYNDARAIERTVDKSMTSVLLHRAGVPTPPAWTAESEADARRIVMRELAAGHALVLKPLFGSQGKGLVKLERGAAGAPPLPPLAGVGGLAYLQRFVQPPAALAGFDWRVLVVGGRTVAAMRRVSAHWIHNVAQGARCEPAPLAQIPAAARIAERAAAALGLDYAGVDLLPDADNGATVIEVNGVAAWRGLQSVSEADIAQALVDDLLDRRCGGRTRAARTLAAG